MRPGIVAIRTNGLVIFPTRAEHARFWAGVDREACLGMAADLDEYILNENCTCHALCVCEERAGA